jgi:hypothetical protein
MNPLDRLLREEMSRCVERIAGAYGEGTLPFVTAHHPRLGARIEEAETRLAGLRSGLLENYAAWEAALEEMENLWALAAMKQAEPGGSDLLKSAA